MKKWIPVFTIVILCLVLISSLALAAQGPIEEPSPENSKGTSANAIYLPIQLNGYYPNFFKVGLVTDTGGIDDGAFNAKIWEGVQRAEDHFGISGDYLESSDESQYEPNLATFASQDYDLVIASGWLLGGPLANVAAQYPDVNFTILDFNYPAPSSVPEDVIGHDECIPNVQGQIFKTDQAAFLAGYLAAGMSAGGKIGIYGGLQIPTVTIFGVGYQAGMEHYNQVHSASVTLVGWDSATGTGWFTNSFSDQSAGEAYTHALFDQGGDIIMPVAGPAGATSPAVAGDRGGLGIWVDIDGYDFLTEDRDVLLTSVLKNMDNTVYGHIKESKNGNFNGCSVYFGDISNGGVGIAPYHDLDSAVPTALKAEIEALKSQIASGVITDTGCISFPQHCPEGLY